MHENRLRIDPGCEVSAGGQLISRGASFPLGDFGLVFVNIENEVILKVKQ